jgi:hypothetical protein
VLEEKEKKKCMICDALPGIPLSLVCAQARMNMCEPPHDLLTFLMTQQ